MIIRVIAYGGLCLVALTCRSAAVGWRRGVAGFVEVRELVMAGTPQETYARVCAAAQGGHRGCRVGVTHKGQSICARTPEGLARLRRFRVQLTCTVNWWPGAQSAPQLTADTYRIQRDLESPQEGAR